MDALKITMEGDRAIQGAGTSEAEWQDCVLLRDLRTITVDQIVEPGKRVVIVAPHPDDELLGFGGLMQLAAERGNPVLLIAVTDGGASHPDSSTWTSERLSEIRPTETLCALNILGLPSVQIVRLCVQDGEVLKNGPALCAKLRTLLSADDVVFVPWILDGHPDHEACSLASSAAASACGAKHVETPIWGWHWASPSESRIPWARTRKLVLPPQVYERKKRAVQCYRSQVEPDPGTRNQPILSPGTLAHLVRPYEVYFFDEQDITGEN